MAEQDLFWQVVCDCVVGSTGMVRWAPLNWLFGHWMGKQAAFLVAYPRTLALHFSLNRWWTFGCQRADAVRQFNEYLERAAAQPESRSQA